MSEPYKVYRISFASKPSYPVRLALKKYGFMWDKKRYDWWARESVQSKAVADFIKNNRDVESNLGALHDYVFNRVFMKG